MVIEVISFQIQENEIDYEKCNKCRSIIVFVITPGNRLLGVMSVAV